jgi:hypothetical protein
MNKFIDNQAEEASEPEEESDGEHEIKGGQDQYYTKEQLQRRMDPKAAIDRIEKKA